MAFNVPEIQKLKAAKFYYKEFIPLFKSMPLVTVSLDFGMTISAKAVASFASDKMAKKELPVCQKALATFLSDRNKAVGWMKKDDLRSQQESVKMLQYLLSELSKSKFQLDDNQVIASKQLNLDWKLAERTVDEFIAASQFRVALKGRTKNLHELVLASHKYMDEHKHFPTHAIVDQNGKPLLSWRVRLLPYLGEQELYKQFRLNEPWDSPHNFKLLSKMPNVYESPGRKGRKTYKTHFQAVRGNGTVFDGQKELSVLSMADGTRDTLMFVEAKNPVRWTKPEDVEYVPGKMLPKLVGLYKGGFHGVSCDGRAYFIREDIGEEMVSRLLIHNDGKLVPRKVTEN